MEKKQGDGIKCHKMAVLYKDFKDYKYSSKYSFKFKEGLRYLRRILIWTAAVFESTNPSLTLKVITSIPAKVLLGV